MTYKVQITPILVHNYVTLNPVTWLYGLIRLWTGSRWNHCVIRVTSIFDDGQRKYVIDEVYDANFRGVISRPFETWAKKSRLCANLELPNSYNNLTLLSRLKNEVGKLYEFGVYWSRVLGVKRKTSDTLYCFELIEKVYGIDKPTDGRHYQQYIAVEFNTGTN